MRLSALAFVILLHGLLVLLDGFCTSLHVTKIYRTSCPFRGFRSSPRTAVPLRAALEDRPEEVGKIRTAARGMLGELLQKMRDTRSGAVNLSQTVEPGAMKSAAQPDYAPRIVAEEQKKLFPVLSRIAGRVWEGEMRYVGEQMEIAPFVLLCTTRCVLEDSTCTIESSVTFPNGKTRTITMRGKKTGKQDRSFRLDPLDEEGPIYLRLVEVAPDTVLLQEFNKTDERVVLTGSISVAADGEEIVQVAHELADQPGPPVKGYQILRMTPQVEHDASAVCPVATPNLPADNL